MRIARAARTIWKKMKLSLIFEMIAERMWGAMEWTRDTGPHAVLQSLKHAFE